MSKTRLHYIDWIRVLAFGSLIFFHCLVPFTQFNWEIKNPTSSIWVDRIVIWLHQWRLPLLFFISGVGVSFSLKKRSIGRFAWERTSRLLIPLAFAMFFIIPIQVYYEWLQKGLIEMSYTEFWPTVWEMVPYPDGTLTWSHMWFVAYLFVFTILLLPVFGAYKFAAVRNLIGKLDVLFKRVGVPLIFSVPFMLYYFSLYIDWPEQGNLIADWWNFISSISFYFIGFLVSGLPSFWNNCHRNRRTYGTLAILTSIGLFIGYYWKMELPEVQDNRLYAYGVLDALFIWSIMLTVIGYSMQWLNHYSARLHYLNRAVYPFYILHQPVIVVSGYYVVQWEIPILIKILLLMLICCLTVFIAYEFIIRRTKLTRVLFGVK